jgi:hypothetical protein
MVSMSDVELPKTRGTQVVLPRSPNRILAGLARFAGVVLMLAAVGIWIISVPMADAAMLVLRLAVSIFFMCLGLMFLQVGRLTLQDEIHLDRKAGALRHVQRGRDGIARVRQEVALADLGPVEIDDDTLILHGRDGAPILELTGLPRDQLHLVTRALNER